MSQRALICDDAMFMRAMISSVLEEAGYEIVGEAENGHEAIEKYNLLKPDFVTMDVIMPDMGGIDAVREIVSAHPDARILMFSAMGQKSLMDDAINAGAKDFVIKPLQPEQVLEAVQRVLSAEGRQVAV